MRLLQEQGNNEQSLMWCLPRPFPTRKQIQEATKAQILDVQNILSTTTASGRFWDRRSCTFLETPDSRGPPPAQLLTALSARPSPLLPLPSLQVWELPRQLLKSQLVNSGHSVAILSLSDEKSVSNLPLTTTAQLVSAPEQSLNLLYQQKQRHRRLLASIAQEWSTNYSDWCFHLPEFPSPPHFHQLHHHPRMKSKQYNQAALETTEFYHRKTMYRLGFDAKAKTKPFQRNASLGALGWESGKVW